jgi:Fe-S-cluster containining protein
MNEAEDFQCSKCATCCRNLIENKEGVIRGLPLTEKETQFFPKEIVLPKLGIGINCPETVVLFQLTVNCCPHLSPKNECQIYLNRPLMCQSFPVVAGAISNRCKVFSYRKPGFNYAEPFTMAKQIEASNKLERYTQKRIGKNSLKNLRIWEYDLATKKWVDKGHI